MFEAFLVRTLVLGSGVLLFVTLFVVRPIRKWLALRRMTLRGKDLDRVAAVYAICRTRGETDRALRSRINARLAFPPGSPGRSEEGQVKP
jgi:hypothetical protein